MSSSTFYEGDDMAFASEFEFEDELELKLVDFEGVKARPKRAPTRTPTRPPAEDKPNPNCYLLCDHPNDPLEFLTYPARGEPSDLSFHARVSWFASKKDTPENAAAADLHRQAATRIASEIMARTKWGGCVSLFVRGLADPKSESDDAEAISKSRAVAFRQQIVDALRVAVGGMDALKSIKNLNNPNSFSGMGTYGPVFLTNDPKNPRINSTAHRMINRRVYVVVEMRKCAE